MFLCKGEWHQYDDIICTEATKFQQFAKTVKKSFGWSEQKESVIKGREIAGIIMLDRIFECLRSWTDDNLRGFWVQLKQFFGVYTEPYVFEEREKKWQSLDYGPANVSSAKQAELLGNAEGRRYMNKVFFFSQVKDMLKKFMAEKFFPQQEDGQRAYGLDPLRAAVIMLSVCQHYKISMKDVECFCLCNALCLPPMTKEDFLTYWAGFLREVSFLTVYVF